MELLGVSSSPNVNCMVRGSVQLHCDDCPYAVQHSPIMHSSDNDNRHSD